MRLSGGDFRRPAMATLLRRAGAARVTAGLRAGHDRHAPGHSTVFFDRGFRARADGDRSYLDRPEAGGPPTNRPALSPAGRWARVSH